MSRPRWFGFRRALASALLALLTPCAAHASLIDYWSFDGCTSTDAVGGQDLTKSGGPVCATGAVGQAWVLDGVTSFLERGAASALAIGSRPWSVAAWMRLDGDTTAAHAMVAWYRCGANPLCNTFDSALWSIWDLKGHAYWDVRDDALHDYDLTDSTVALGDHQWHLVVGTLSAAHDSLHLYVDGVHRGGRAVTIGTLTGSPPLEIGRWYRVGWAQPDYYFPGAIDEVRIYDEELSRAAVASLYAARVAGVPVAPGAGTGLALERVAPNPVRASRLSLAFTAAGGAPVRVELLDVLGRTVMSRVFDALADGRHELTLDGHGTFPPGVYLVRVRQGAASVSRRVTVLR
jgi:hypothetical protein